MENNELTEVKAAMPSLEGLPQEVIEYVMGLVAENVQMDKFIDECLQTAWEGGSMDGSEIQDIGLKNGLLREETYSADQHENLVEDPSNFEDGDAIYTRTEMTGTDAAIAEIGAKAIEIAINAQIGKPCITDKTNGLVYINLGGLQDFAANLRAGRKCNIPPAGWRCTRAAGHEGPCAAVEDASHE